MNSNNKKNIGTISIPVDGAKMILVRIGYFLLFTVANGIAIDLIIKNPIGSIVW